MARVEGDREYSHPLAHYLLSEHRRPTIHVISKPTLKWRMRVQPLFPHLLVNNPCAPYICHLHCGWCSSPNTRNQFNKYSLVKDEVMPHISLQIIMKSTLPFSFFEEGIFFLLDININYMNNWGLCTRASMIT